MKKINIKVLWITRTAIFIALLIVFQAISSAAGQLVTGSLVNLVLVTAALTAGIWSAVAVAVISPFLAFFLGIGPQLIQMIPIVAIGNLVYVIIAALAVKLIRSEKPALTVVRDACAVIVGSLLKFGALYLGVVKIFIPAMGDALKAPQIEKFTAMFSVPQLITALIGGAVAIPVAIALNRILKIKKD